MEVESISSLICQALPAGEVEGLIIPVTSGHGERVYCKLHDGDNDGEPLKAKGAQCARSQLLSKPISLLLEEIEDDSYTAAVRATAKIDEAADRQRVKGFCIACYL